MASPGWESEKGHPTTVKDEGRGAGKGLVWIWAVKLSSAGCLKELVSTAKSPSSTEVCVLKVPPRHLGHVLQGEELRLMFLRWMYHLTNPRQSRMCSPKKQIMGSFGSSHAYKSYLSHDISVSGAGGADFAWEPLKDAQMSPGSCSQ